MDGGASVEFYDSDITNNYAFNIPFTDFPLAEKKSIINHCRISNNTVLSKEYIQEVLMVESDFNPNYAANIRSNDGYFIADEIFDAVIVTQMGEIEIGNGTIISDQAMVIRAVDSNIIMNGVQILNINTNKNVIVSVQGKISITDVTIENLTMAGNFDILNALDSVVNINKVSYKNSKAQFMTSSFCELSIDDFTSEEVSNIIYLFRIISSKGIIMKNSTFRSISPSSTLFDIYYSDIELVENVSISEVTNYVMEISLTDAKLLKNITVHNCSNSVLIKDSTISNWTGSKFQNCGNENVEQGGAMNILRSNMILSDSEFVKNTAKSGAAIAIDCEINSKCENILKNIVFSSNIAKIQGAGIYYNMHRPIMSEIVFTNNSAPYGSNIASFPYNIIFSKIQHNKVTIDSAGSGIIFDESYEVKIIDYDNQTMNLINTRSVKLQAESSDSSISVGGIDNSRITNGIAELSNFTFIAAPGSQGITYNIVTSHIDYSKIDLLSKAKFNPLKATDKSGFFVAFRYCKPGEYQTSDGKCNECSIKTYSLEWNSTSCDACMANAECQGKDHVEVSPGYWRKNLTSTHVAHCLREKSCLGGFNPSRENPVDCEKGYEGFLCAKCSVSENEKYHPSTNFECSKCPSPILNAFEFIGFQIIALGFIYFIIIINIRKKGENQLSILLRIFTNYTQLIAAILSFNIKFPNIFEDVSSQSDRVSSPERTFFSFDCFIDNNEVRMFAPSNELFKLVLYLFLPIFLLIVLSSGILLYRLVMHFVKPEMTHDLKRYIAISFICIIFIFHPTMTFQSLRVFQCAIVDKEDSRMMMHMDYKCFSGDHLKWIFLVGFPILVIWVIGMPVIAFIILYKKRSTLDSPQKQKYLLLLYQGLKNDAFYWELVNTFRKFLVLSFNIFLSTYDPYYRILGAIISLVILMRIQERLKPYKKDSNNRIEVIGVAAGILTLYCTIVFVTPERRINSVYYGSFLLLFLVNAFFLVNWFYYVLCYLDYKHPSFVTFMKIYSFVLCKRGSQFNQEITEKRLITHNSRKKVIRNRKKKRVTIKKNIKKLDVKKKNLLKNRKSFYKHNSGANETMSKMNPTSMSRVENTSEVVINPS
ncbi:unnamed protein product [Moneuplotes crassus]|uniref:Uncharacterized protein n=1 Tax=Euplotes crassus TaxID=5936 RepID=A0AAD1U9F1_EUPCR|nr:unnamed protein product [Moneuplotes crassus]